MTGGWAFEGQPAALSGGTVTLVNGTSFCVCGHDGEIHGGGPQGIFFLDTRIVSGWRVRIDDAATEPITAVPAEPFRTTFLGRAVLGRRGESTLLVERTRYVGAGMREDVVLRNYGPEDLEVTLTVHVQADFADLFEVKEDRVRADQRRSGAEAREDGLELHRGSRGVRVSADHAEYDLDRLTFHARVPARGEWSTRVTARPVVDGELAPALFPLDEPVEQSAPMTRARQWHESGPVLRVFGAPSLMRTLQQSREDLGALRIFDPERPQDTVIAAGAPWFMTLFGRDSILSSLMALPIDPTLALGTAQTLARHQGKAVEQNSEEEPGRILHEIRFGADSSLALGGRNVYYGTADATPLFVMLLGELSRWGIGDDQMGALLPHADRALEWVDHHGDRDGDGFVEYHRTTPRGLVNQGWKDSWDGVNFADGTIASSPIALCEVQGYVYAAFRARACLARVAGDDPGYWEDRARALKKKFNDAFWLPELGRYAVALDHAKRPVDSVTSNVGHCLWTGIVDDDKAEQVAESLMSKEMFTGWGVRTLSSDMGAYNPMSYHNGSVWPHDSTIVAAGLMRYGFVDHAQRLASALFDAAEAFGGRLPELLCGFDRTEYARPVPYPTSCSPQAWASASPVHLLRVLLRLEPAVPDGKVRLAPALPDEFLPIAIDNVPLAGTRVTVEVDSEVRVSGLPTEIVLSHDTSPGFAGPFRETRPKWTN
ncbi:glycogen debranching N-terminal domain-containing protein [Lentzea albida]|uniref:Glycogen debranching enzyme (Alpha-1,6-glucosidase) n=1 Tax=Lentzea albida TaxID=65499 RepID=A0A1H9XDS0_9PSEU|nr:glycogen debranching N-terminal domain-containing protein [Lentzea albida]SES44348.1 Glycogen debranching enzyme (alpha-1,6-glucosidase) [Lentzea albida]